MAWTIDKIIADCKAMCKEYRENQQKLTSAKFDTFQARFETKHHVTIENGDFVYSVEVDDVLEIDDATTIKRTVKGFLGIKTEIMTGSIRFKRSDGGYDHCPCKDIGLVNSVDRGDRIRIKGKVDVRCDSCYYRFVDYQGKYCTDSYALHIKFRDYPKIKRVK